MSWDSAVARTSSLGSLPLESIPWDGLQQRLFPHCWVHTLVSVKEVAGKRVVEEIFFSWFVPQEEKNY